MLVLILAVTLSLALAAPAGAAELFVVNKDGNDVSVIDMDTGKTLAAIPTGTGPHEVAISPDGLRAVVTNYAGGDSLTVIDVPARKVERTIDLGDHGRPHGVMFFPDNRRVAVTTEGSGSVLVADARTGRIESTVATQQDVSHMVALSPDAKRAYVANIGSGSLTVIDLAAGKVIRQVGTGAGAEGLAITPDGREIWVSNRAADTVSIVDAESLTVKETLPSPGFPIRVAMTPGGKHALVTNAKSGELAVFDVGTRREIRRLKLLESEDGLMSSLFGRGSFPVGVIADPDGTRIFVAITGGDRIAVVGTRDWTVERYWQAGDEPDGMAIVP